MNRSRRASVLRAELETLERRRLLSSDNFHEAIGFPVITTPAHATSDIVAGESSTSRQPTGPLTGKIVYTVGGHGFTAYSGGWHTQRPLSNGMVEDMGNQDQMTAYVDYLWNAGATVVPLRPVGYQPNEVVLDNDDPQVTYSGAWSNSSSTMFYGSAGDVPYRFASISPTQTATARYTPNIPVAGFYPIYAWARAGSDRVNQLYRVTHAGGTTDVSINHRRVGNGWVYLGTYYLNAGATAYVEISNQSNEASGVVIADAIRFGNGMGDIDRGLGVSQQTRSDESALYWIEAQAGQGVSKSTYYGSLTNDDDANVGAPPRWAAWMNRESDGAMTDRLFLSFHSNAAGGGISTTRGTLGLYNGNHDPTTATPHQQAWASLVGTEVNNDMVALGSQIENPWSNNPNPTLDRTDIEFGEINNHSINSEFDATICEVAYHDNLQDAQDLEDPKARNWVARAAEQATVRYFNQFGSVDLNFLPDPVTNVSANVDANGDVTVAWNAPVVDGIGGDAATGYVVYTSDDGKSFANPAIISGGATTSYKFLKASIGTGVKYFRVVATNLGGDSLASEVVAAHSASTGSSPILIVNGFDRIDRNLDVRQTTPLDYDPPFAPGTGSTVERVRPRFENSYDYVVQAASAIAAYATTYGIDSCQNDAIISGQINLANYKAVIWMDGEESTADHTFDSTEQTKVTNYLNAGGKLFVSGSEIGFDLVGGGHGAAFYSNNLKTSYVSDDTTVSTYTAAGAAGSIFAGISVTFDNGTQFYDVGTPDVIGANGGSTVAMSYSGGASGGAAIQYSSGNIRIVNMAFPFETITDPANRNLVMQKVLNYFGPLNSALGAISGKVYKDINGSATFDTGDLPLSGWTVFIDANGNGFPDAGDTTTTSNASGDYVLGGLADGTYSVREVLQSGNIRTQPASGYSVVVALGSANPGKDFGNFPISYVGSSGPDTYIVRMDPANNGKVQIIENGSTTYTIAKSLLTTFSIDGAGGDDRFTVDYTTASPIPTGGITLSGGTHATGDALNITGSSAADTITIDSANITCAGVIHYSGIEAVTASTGASNDTLNYNGPVTPAVTFNGGSNADALNVNGGTYTFTADARAGTDNLAITASAGTVMFNASQHLAALTIQPNAAGFMGSNGNRYLQTAALSIIGAGKLDLNDNDLIVTYTGASPFTTVRQYVFDGYSNTPDLSKTGVVSTTGQSAGNTILALLDNALVGATEWPLGSGNTVPGNSVVGKYTYFGDANFDGQVTPDDYGVLDAHFGLTPAPGLAWLYGDMNLDGSVTSDDYGILDANFGAGSSGPLSPALAAHREDFAFLPLDSQVGLVLQ